MPVDDLYLQQRGPDGKRLPSKRHGQGRRYRVREPQEVQRLLRHKTLRIKLQTVFTLVAEA